MTDLPDPTPRQLDVLERLRRFAERHGRTPTGPELARELGVTPRAAYDHLRRLAERGLVRVEQPGERRALRVRLTEQGRRLTGGWPRLGAIPAGPLTPFADEVTGTVERVEDLVPQLRDGDFFLEVAGDSMVDAGLEDGALVVVRPGPATGQGCVCAVWVDGEGGTLKRVYERGATIELRPENARYEPRTYPAERVHVQGVVVATLAVRPIR